MPELSKSIKNIYVVDIWDNIVDTMVFDGEKFFTVYDCYKNPAENYYRPVTIGQTLDLYIKIEPKIKLGYTSESEFSGIYKKAFYNLQFSEQFYSFDLGYLTSKNELYFNEPWILKKYDLSTQVLSTFFDFGAYLNDFTVSPGGNFVLAGILDTHRNYRIFNNGTLSDSIIRYDIFDPINIEPYFQCVSDNGIAIAQLQNETYIFDCSGFSIIKKLDAAFDNGYKISANGKFFAGSINGTLHYYSITNGSEVNEIAVPQAFKTGKPSFVFSESGEFLCLLVSNTFYKLNSNDLSIVTQFPVDATRICSIDMTSNLLLCGNGGILQLHDLSSGTEKLTVYGQESRNYFLRNNTIYSNDGFKLRIN